MIIPNTWKNKNMFQTTNQEIFAGKTIGFWILKTHWSHLLFLLTDSREINPCGWTCPLNTWRKQQPLLRFDSLDLTG
jgi:hypothetical protein